MSKLTTKSNISDYTTHGCIWIHKLLIHTLYYTLYMYSIYQRAGINMDYHHTHKIKTNIKIYKIKTIPHTQYPLLVMICARFNKFQKMNIRLLVKKKRKKKFECFENFNKKKNMNFVYYHSTYIYISETKKPQHCFLNKIK